MMVKKQTPILSGIRQLKNGFGQVLNKENNYIYNGGSAGGIYGCRATLMSAHSIQ